MHWLVVRGGALGDFILTIPALRQVRSEASTVTLACRPRFATLVPDLADKVIDLHSAQNLWLFGAGPLPDRYDGALVYTPGVADLLRQVNGLRVVEGPAQPFPGSGHATDQLSAPTRAPPGSHPDLKATPAALRDIDQLLAQLGLGESWPVVLAPGAASPLKQWPGIAVLADLLIAARIPVVVAPGIDEERDLLPAGLPRLPELDLPALVALATRSGAWIGNDTGTTHLATAAGAPVFAMFGPTDPAIWGPRPPVAGQAQALPFATSPSLLMRLADSSRATRVAR
jgi:heptosyltransferase III